MNFALWFCTFSFDLLVSFCGSFFPLFYQISIEKTAKICYNTHRIGGSNARRQVKINRHKKVTQINIVSQNTGKQCFFSYQAETAQKSTKDYVRKINLFMQNEPNLCGFWAVSGDCEEKRTQNEPNQTQFKPKQTQFSDDSPVRNARFTRYCSIRFLPKFEQKNVFFDLT